MQRHTVPAVLPPGIRSRLVNDVNGIRMHVLEAGFDTPGRPAVLFSSTAFQSSHTAGGRSWGRSPPPDFTSSRPTYEGTAAPQVPDVKYHRRPSAVLATFNKIRDVLALMSALGHRSVAAVIGHDSGLAARRLVRTRTTRRLPIGGHDERPVRRPARAAVQYRELLPERQDPSVNADAIYEELAALTPPAQALSAVLHNSARPTTTCGTRRREYTRSCACTTT